MMQNVSFSFLKSGVVKLKGTVDAYVNFISDFQMKNANLWQKFTHVFEVHEDIKDDGWRGEYWGKMMRGACLTYYYTKDEELYSVLENTVKDLLTKQDTLGRISSYSIEREFNGWDMWARKYVITGLLHFVDICKSENLKQNIYDALHKHLDYILDKVGEKEGQVKIELTSTSWGGVNSCTILEPTLDFYKRTGEKKYLEFAEYILSTGGSSLGDLLHAAIDNKLKPCEYPVQKAYEVMSFFEGVLAYYELTNDERYLTAVKNFVEAVQETEITIIGCAGLLGECFNGATMKQTEIVEYPTQETCVTVTWIRLLTRLYKNIGWVEYANRIELSILNALYGSINTEKLVCCLSNGEVAVEKLPFDSYSPLNNARRSLAVGGFKDLQLGGYYGCCACIGAVAVALVPLTAVMKSGNGYRINYYHEVEVKDDDFEFSIAGDYLFDGKVELTINKTNDVETEISFRVPNWCKRFIIESENGVIACDDGTKEISKVWKVGEKLVIKLSCQFETIELNGYKAFKYGPLILARDNIKEIIDGDVNNVDFDLSNDNIVVEKLPIQKGEMVRFKVAEKNSQNNIILTDYASCGKLWDSNNQISVWLKNK